MLNQIRYKNFKSWKDTGEIALGPITGFFGTNSSGKTSLLQGLLLLKQTIESSDRHQILEFGDETNYVGLGSMSETIFKHEPGVLSFELNWQALEKLRAENPEARNEALFEGNTLKFNTEIEFGAKNKIEVKGFQYELDRHIFRFSHKNGKNEYGLHYEGDTRFHFKREDGRKWPIKAPLKFYGFPDQVYSYHKNARFLQDFQLAIETLFQRIYYLGPLREYPKRQYVWRGSVPNVGTRGDGAVEAILASDNRGYKIKRGYRQPHWLLGEYVAYWLKELGLIFSFEPKEISPGSGYYQVWVKKTPSSPEVLITDVGFGVSQILPVITLCYFVPENSILIIEQPEIHLHPKVQAGLADVFIDAIKTRNIQIVLESHSEHLLRRLQLRLAQEKITPKEVKLYFCETKDDHSDIKALEIDLYGTISNWPKDFFGNEFEEIAAMNLAKITRLKAA